MGAGFDVEELDKIGLATGTIVELGLGLARGEELDGGVRLDALLLRDALAVLSLNIDLGDNNMGLVGKGEGEVLPDRGEVLAVCEQLAKIQRLAGNNRVTYGRTREQ